MNELKKTFFFNTTLAKIDFSNSGVSMSTEFLDCAGQQLTTFFNRMTGLSPNKNISLVSRSNIYNEQFVEVGEISKLKASLYVNHNWNMVVILWKSKSGRIYKTDDTDIDCDDIEFWFEKLNTELYIKQLYPSGQKLPFVIKDLPFELEVTRLNMDCSLLITVDPGKSPGKEDIINSIHIFIGAFNEKSEKNDREDGVIHNSSGKIENDTLIVYEMDLGSVGFGFFKKLLKHLAKIQGIRRVEIA